ncbi:MAG: galactitol-phosphate 5-dehydrogenase [Clostridia bacterium]|jgi:2-desacetyl-2-hydroxyethyl bacteriochlorophyllide A dehydrogenase|nr:galactitol-phosphate 5-dehydrogenase [Clostridia bacterium]
MKALVYNGPFDLTLKDLPKPVPSPGEVVIKIQAASICGSDVTGYKGKSNMRIAPLVMGHEFSGIVTEISEDVNKDKIGARVAVVPNLYCGKCINCLEGNINLCDFRKIVGTTMAVGGYNGAMAEYVAVRLEALLYLPDSVSFHEAALLEPFAVALHAVKKAGDLKNKSALIVGAGPIGLLVLKCLKYLGAISVIVTDLVDNRLELASKLGADKVINTAKENASEAIKSMTNSIGVDIALDAVGISASINQCIDSVRNNGKIILIGMAAQHLDFEFKQVVCREIQMFGSYTYTTEMQECLDILNSGQVNLNDLITGIFPIEEGPAIFASLAEGNSEDIKVILTM